MASCINYPIVEQMRTEALALLVEAKNDQLCSLSEKRGRQDPGRLFPVLKNLYATAQLSWVISWALYQKAISSSEIAKTETQNLLPPLEPFCPSANTEPEEMEMSDGMARRLERSQQLYDRAVRLGLPWHDGCCPG